MIVLDVGHTLIKVFNDNKIFSIKIEEINELYDLLKENQNRKIYIGSVNKKVLNDIETKLIDFGLDYKLICNKNFVGLVPICKNIDINEIGLDILSSIYYIEDSNYILINSGTALVYVKYTNQIDGVIISNNLFVNTNDLLKKIDLKYSYNDLIFNFSTNTSDCISASINLYFVKTIKYLSEINLITKFYLNNIDESIIGKIQNITFKKVFEPTINGYIKLINKIGI